MTDDTQTCPECAGEYPYERGGMMVCSICGHEWVAGAEHAVAEVRDAVGNVLNDGDSVTVVKDLKVKGASGAVKKGTKVRGIRLVDGVDGHDIDCKIDGFGRMQLKSSVVKKA